MGLCGTIGAGGRGLGSEGLPIGRCIGCGTGLGGGNGCSAGLGGGNGCG